MARKLIVGIAVILACTVVPIGAIFAYESYRTRSLTAEIIARAPERGNFSPSRLVLPVGRKAVLRIRNVDTVSHGFAVPSLGIDVGELKAGHIAIVEFTPEHIGSYDFYCTVWCSEHHLQMRGIIEVVSESDSYIPDNHR